MLDDIPSIKEVSIMPHKTVHLKNDKLANCNGSLYAAWIQEKAPFDQLTADSIAHDILWITGKAPFPLDQMAIIEAMSQQEPGFTLQMKLFLFGYLCGVHKQRRKDRAAEQSRCLAIKQNPVHAACAACTELPPETCVDNLQSLMKIHQEEIV